MMAMTFKRRLLAADCRCTYCGYPLSEIDATLDHIIPKSLGGSDEDDNKTLACHDCNREKRNLGPVKFVLRQAMKGNLRPFENPKIRAVVQLYIGVA